MHWTHQAQTSIVFKQGRRIQGSVMTHIRASKLLFTSVLAALLVQLEHVGDVNLVPCPARRQALTHEIGLLANQFDVKHGAL